MSSSFHVSCLHNVVIFSFSNVAIFFSIHSHQLFKATRHVKMATQTKIQNYFNKRPVPRVPLKQVKISSFLKPVDESEKDDVIYVGGKKLSCL